MSIFRALLALTLAIALAGCANKKVEKPSPLVELPTPEVQALIDWRVNTGSGPGRYPVGLRMASDGDWVFSADIDGRVTAIDVATGERRWVVKTKLRISAGPSLVDGQLMLGALDGDLLSLDPQTGAENWRSELPGEILAAPAGDSDVIVIRTGDGRLYGVSAIDGSQRWAYDRDVPPLTLRGMSTPQVLAGGVVTGHDGGRVTVVTLAEGNPVWEQIISAPTGRSELERLVDVDAELVIQDDWLYVASYGGDVVAMDLASGAVRWRRAVKTHVGMVSDAERLYVTASNGSVWCLDRFSGVRVWQQDALLRRGVSAPVLFKGNIVVGDKDGYLHWLSPVDGGLVARRRAGSATITAPMRVEQGRLLVFSDDGAIVALDVKPSNRGRVGEAAMSSSSTDRSTSRSTTRSSSPKRRR